MTYVDGMVATVATAKCEKFKRHDGEAAMIFGGFVPIVGKVTRRS
jgi:uncharacterized protein YbaA (DUF1428 family)